MDVDEALTELLHDTRTGGRREDLTAAAVEAWRRRHVNTEAGAAVIAALTDLGMSYQQIEDVTGIPRTTAHRWARPPEQATGDA